VFVAGGGSFWPPAMHATEGVHNLFHLGVSDGRERDPFPLPMLRCSVDAGSLPNSSPSRRRLGRRLAVNERIAAATSALNLLAAGGPSRDGRLKPPTAREIRSISEAPRAAQRDVLLRLRSAVLEDPPPLVMPAGPRALGELLRSAGGSYASSRGAVGAYFAGGPSLPSSACGTVRLEDVLPPSWAERLVPENVFVDEALRQQREAALDIDCYMDEVLRDDPAAYGDYLASLYRAGMIRLDLQPTGFCTPFFVWKDDALDSLRCLFDCRVVNEGFADAPPTRLMTAETFTKLKLEDDQTLFGTGYDVKDFYHAILMPDWLSSRFGLPAVSSEVLASSLAAIGVTCPALEGGKVYPCLCSLPMGWKWAVSLAQAIHEHAVQQGVPTSEYLSDRARPEPFGLRGKIFAYLDDGSVMDVSPDRANAEHVKIASGLSRLGFQLHEKKCHEARAHWEKLGVSIDGEKGEVRSRSDRRWRLEAGCREWLRRVAVKPCELEVLLAHFTQAFLLRRPLLSIFHYAYEWVRKGPPQRSALPTEVRREVEAALALLPLAFSRMRAPVYDHVYVTDSSETHYAVMRSKQDVKLIRDASLWSEKWRFDPSMTSSSSRSLPPGQGSCSSLPRKTSSAVGGGGLGLMPHLRLEVENWLQSGFGPSPAYLELPRVDNRSVKKGLEVFSGSGHWSAALRKRGFDVSEVDYDRNPKEDILDDVFYLDLILRIVRGEFSALHFGTPCRTWSQARWPPLRSNRYLLSGLPNLTAAQRALVREGNELSRPAFVLMNLASLLGALVSVENPASSRLWLHPAMLRWLADYKGIRTTTVYCAWGKPYMKPTAIASNFHELSAVHRVCTRDHVHTVLRGTNSDGVFLTALASAYPMPLCEAWADCIVRAHIRCATETRFGACNFRLLPIAEETVTVEDECCLDLLWPNIHPVESHFPMVPGDFVLLEKQQLLYNQKWLRHEPIHILEARASFKALCHASRTPSARGARVLILCDNMSVVLAMNKGRCRCYPLLKLCRRAAAYSLAAHIVPTWRYIETGRNCADGPTRPSGPAAAKSFGVRDPPLREIHVPPPGQSSRGFGAHGRHM